MRIFMLVQHQTARGPVPKHTRHLVAALREAGCVVVTHPWGQRGPEEPVHRKLVERAVDVRSVGRALSGTDFDVAVVKTAHDWHTLLRDLAVVLAIRRRCRPVVLQLHGSRPEQLTRPGRYAFKAVTALLLRLTDGLLVLSTEEQTQWRTFRPTVPVWTVKNPYVRVFADDPPARGDSGDVPVALFVGRLITEKGIFDLVDAFRSVVDTVACRLEIVGDGEQEQALRERVRVLGLDGHVQFRGYVSGEDLRPLYEQASLVVLPSWSEGFPTVLAEAMDAGLPIVTTRIRGAADHLVDAEHALFVEPRDVAALAAAIRALVVDDDLRLRMGAANRERIGIFEPPAVAAEYEHALVDAVRRSGVARGRSRQRGTSS